MFATVFPDPAFHPEAYPRVRGCIRGDDNLAFVRSLLGSDQGGVRDSPSCVGHASNAGASPATAEK